MPFSNDLNPQNMGQRLVELELSYTANADGSGVLHCSNLPPNPAIFPPGPACEWLFLSSPQHTGIFSFPGSLVRRREWHPICRHSRHGRFR